MTLRKSIVWGLGLLVAASGAVVAVGREAIPRNVAYVSEELGEISVIDLNSLVVTTRIQPKDVAPRGLSLTFDGKYLFTANKNTADASVFDTGGLQLVRRVPVGNNPEFVKINPSGTRIFTSFEPASTGAPPAPGANIAEQGEPPSQVIQFRVRDWTEGKSFTAGLQTEGLEFSSDGKQLVVANEAQDTLGVYDSETGKLVQTVSLGALGNFPRGVKRSPQGNGYAVTMEGSGTLVILDPHFKVIRSVATASRPYGVAFDRTGRRIFVAAAGASKLQIFSADSLQPLGEVSIGQRCWHFTFTPDDSKVLVACGRSNNVYAIDANTYEMIKVLGGFKIPWGIVTYPRSYGSLDLP
jgi:YVTN family beta-propeller protein